MQSKSGRKSDLFRDRCSYEIIALSVSAESDSPRSRHAKKAPVTSRSQSLSVGRKEETHATSRKEKRRTTRSRERARSTGRKEEEEAHITLSRSLTPLEEVLATNLGASFSVVSAVKDVGVVDGQGPSVFLTQDEGGGGR